jgi:uncharacterized membrane protein
MRLRELHRLSWTERAIEAARWINPVASGPSAPLETVAYLDSFGVSLMPRTSRLQGVASGLAVLGARSATGVVDLAMRRFVPPSARLSRKLAGRAIVGGIAGVIGAMAVPDDAPTWRHTVKSVGLVLRAAAIGGAVYDALDDTAARYPAKSAIRPIGVSVLVFAGTAFWAKQRLERREEEIRRWPIPQPNTVAEALPVSWIVIGAGMGITRAAIFTRGALIDYLGDGMTKNMLARVVNAAMWASAATLLYSVGVGYVGRANEKVEPGYSMPPTSELVSGSPSSYVTFEDLGQQGRRYVTDVVTPELIEEVMGEPAVAHPIRTFIGFNTEPLYQTGRAELALAELERTGAFDRSYLLLVSPTGTGWVDHTLIESAELIARGDIATCCIQYGKFPSFLSLQKVALGRHQFQLLLWGVKQRLEERPRERRPKVLIFGESIGAWTASDTVMFAGIKGFDHYGIHKALWVGLPWLAKWSRSGMARGASDLVPEGTVRVFDNPGQLKALDAEERAALRALILSHDNDPIAVFGPDLAVKPPHWLGADRGRAVPASMEWNPGITFIQTAIDAANAMVTVPGEFLSFGHDYRADMASVVCHGLDLPASSDEQLAAVEATLRRLELERAERIEAAAPEKAPTPPSHQTEAHRIAAGVPLQVKRTRSSVIARLVGKKGPPQGDIQ